MRLHLPAVPHTITRKEFSHCAFTGKVLKFPKMIHHAPGYVVTHYGVEGSETEADENVVLMTREEQEDLLGHDHSDPTRFVGNDGDVGNALYKEFNSRLREALRTASRRDLVLLPFGHAHGAAVEGLGLRVVESGIGYPTLYEPAQFRIFESYAWLHYHQGIARRGGHNYEWVIPNYFDVDEWDFDPEGDPGRVVYFGRIEKFKGLDVFVEIAKHRQDLHFVICGQGDPSPWLGLPNVEYLPPIFGRARSEYLGGARCLVAPTEYTEPFGGVAVEAMLTGTPVLSSDHGAFSETVENGRTGFRCKTLGDYLAGIEVAPRFDRRYISERARGLYGFEPIAGMYDRAFRQIADLDRRGWYEPSCRDGFVGLRPGGGGRLSRQPRLPSGRGPEAASLRRDDGDPGED